MIVDNAADIKQCSCLKVIQAFHKLSRFFRIVGAAVAVIIETASCIKRIAYRFFQVIQSAPFSDIVCGYKRAFFLYQFYPFFQPCFHSALLTAWCLKQWRKAYAFCASVSLGSRSLSRATSFCMRVLGFIIRN